MKKLLFAILFLLTLASSIFAAPVTVSQITIPNWQAGGSTAELRVYSDKSFYASDGTFIPATRVDSRTAYITVTCTVAGTNVTCPQIAMQTTDDGTDRQDARYTVRLYTDTGKPTEVFLLINAVVPSTQAPNTTWTAIAAANSMATPTPTPTDAYTTSEADGIHATITTLANTALTQANAAIDAIGLNIPDEATLATSITTSSANPSTKYFYNVSDDVSLTSNRTIPSNVVTKVGSGGKFIQTGSYTLRIQGALESPPVELFSGFSSGQVKIMSNAFVYPQWWGCVADGTTDCYPGIQAAADSRGIIGAGFNDLGTKILFPTGIYRTSARIRSSSVNAFEGTAGGGWEEGNTVIKPDAGVGGFLVEKSTTSGSPQGDGDYTSFTNLSIIAAGKSGSTADGIKAHGRVRLENVYVRGFARNCINLDTASQLAGNTNGSYFEDVKGYSCGSDTGITASMTSGSNVVTSSNAAFVDFDTFGTLVKIKGAKQLTVTDATNAFPIVVKTSVKHNWGGQDTVTIASVGGNTAANGTWGILWDGDYTFSLTTLGNGTYTSGGTVNGSLTVTAATNTTPIYITTSTPHGLSDGNVATITGVGGNTAANGTWKITSFGANDFSIAPYGNGAYTSGGTAIGDLIGFLGTPTSPTSAPLYTEGAGYITPVALNATVSVSSVVMKVLGHGLFSGGNNSTISNVNNYDFVGNIGAGIYEDGSYGSTYGTGHLSGNQYGNIVGGVVSTTNNKSVFINPYNEGTGRYPNRIKSVGTWKLGGTDGNGYSDDTIGVLSQRAGVKFLGQFVTIGVRNNTIIETNPGVSAFFQPTLSVAGGTINQPFAPYLTTNADAANFQSSYGAPGYIVRGVAGYGQNNGGGTSIGVYGESLSGASGTGYGGHFKATGNSGTAAYGVYLEASGATFNYAIYEQSGNNRLTGFTDIIASPAPSVSGAAAARMYLDDISNKFRVSVNGGLFYDLLTANSWATPGAIGATTPSTGAFTTLSSTGTATVKKLNRSGTVALTPSANVAIDASLADVFNLTPAEAEAISISNMSIGQNVTLLVLTSGTTPYVLTFGTGFKPSGTLSTGSVDAKYFVLQFFCDGTLCYETSRTGAL